MKTEILSIKTRNSMDYRNFLVLEAGIQRGHRKLLEKNLPEKVPKKTSVMKYFPSYACEQQLQILQAFSKIVNELRWFKVLRHLLPVLIVLVAKILL